MKAEKILSIVYLSISVFTWLFVAVGGFDILESLGFTIHFSPSNINVFFNYWSLSFIVLGFAFLPVYFFKKYKYTSLIVVGIFVNLFLIMTLVYP